MRRTVVAGVALIASLALAAVPGPASSRGLPPPSAVDSGSFRTLHVPAILAGAALPTGPADPALRSAASVDPLSAFAEPGEVQPVPASRPRVNQPAAAEGSGWKPPRYTLSGLATFYDNGTTAMRLPRGTVVVICMAGGCIERAISDYGPAARGGRIVDLDKDDFFAICRCPSWSGVEPVSVKVYGTWRSGVATNEADAARERA